MKRKFSLKKLFVPRKIRQKNSLPKKILPKKIFNEKKNLAKENVRQQNFTENIYFAERAILGENITCT